jgi:hypothetical protein
MTLTNRLKLKPDLSSTKPKENLTVQDAIIAVAVFASQLDPNDCDEDIKKIQSLAQNHPLFSEDSDRIRSRIYKFANYMGTENAEKLVNLAAGSLTSEMKNFAFTWAMKLFLDEDGELGNKENLLDDLRIQLAIDSHIAKKIAGDIMAERKSR